MKIRERILYHSKRDENRSRRDYRKREDSQLSYFWELASNSLSSCSLSFRPSSVIMPQWIFWYPPNSFASLFHHLSSKTLMLKARRNLDHIDVRIPVGIGILRIVQVAPDDPVHGNPKVAVHLSMLEIRNLVANLNYIGFLPERLLSTVQTFVFPDLAQRHAFEGPPTVAARSIGNVDRRVSMFPGDPLPRKAVRIVAVAQDS